MTFNDFIKSINKETCTDENGYPYYQMYQLKEAFEAGQKEAAINCVQYIENQGTIGVSGTKEKVYYVVDDDLKNLRDEFGIEI